MILCYINYIHILCYGVLLRFNWFFSMSQVDIVTYSAIITWVFILFCISWFIFTGRIFPLFLYQVNIFTNCQLHVTTSIFNMFTFATIILNPGYFDPISEMANALAVDDDEDLF